MISPPMTREVQRQRDQLALRVISAIAIGSTRAAEKLLAENERLRIQLTLTALSRWPFREG